MNKRDSGLEAISRTALVIGGLCLLVFLLGSVGLLSEPWLAASAILSIIACAALVYRPLSGAVSSSHYDGPRGLTIALGVVIALALASVLPLALTPPTVRDELIQHLSLPAYYLSEGWMAPLQAPFSYLPHNGDLLYTIPLSLGSDVAPRVVHLAFAALTAAAVYAYMARRAGRVWAMLGSALFLSTPLIMNLSRMAYVDLVVGFFSAVSVFAALRWAEGPGEDERSGEVRWLIYSAAAMGFAMGTKYSALPAFALVGVFVFFVSIRRSGGVLPALGWSTLFAVVAVAALAPWLARTWIFAGNPFYPLYKVAATTVAAGDGVHLGGGLAPMEKRVVLYGEGLWEVAAAPLRIFWEGRDNSIRSFDGVLNPFFLALFPLAFVRRRQPAVWYLAGFTVVFFFIAFFTTDLVLRYLMPAFVAIVILAALGGKNLYQWGRAGRALLWAVLAAFVVFSAIYMKGLYAEYRPLAYLSGAETRGEYLGRVLPDYRAVERANTVLPEDARVLSLFAGDRTYYWEREVVVYDRLGISFKGIVRGAGNADGLAERLSGRGVTHIFLREDLFQKFANDNFGPGEIRMLVEFFNTRADRVVSVNGFSVYALK